MANKCLNLRLKYLMGVVSLLAIYPSDASKQVMVLRDVVTQSQVLEALAEAGPSLDPKTAAVTSEKK